MVHKLNWRLFASNFTKLHNQHCFVTKLTYKYLPCTGEKFTIAANVPCQSRKVEGHKRNLHRDIQ
eukprot:8654555-Ditylum_brightwellii.AAC.1